MYYQFWNYILLPVSKKLCTSTPREAPRQPLLCFVRNQLTTPHLNIRFYRVCEGFESFFLSNTKSTYCLSSMHVFPGAQSSFHTVFLSISDTFWRKYFYFQFVRALKAFSKVILNLLTACHQCMCFQEHSQAFTLSFISFRYLFK